MRAFFAFVLATVVPISIGYAAACGPPSSFDELTGGDASDGAVDQEAAAVPLTEDKTLPPPRAIGPLSGSWINGSRPRFGWEPAQIDAVGARVIVCADQRCDPATTKTWTGVGRELIAPEDLPPGRYFWKLVTTSPTGYGTNTSPMWTLLVRGGKGNGVPSGQIADVNGDGIADLLVSGDVMDDGKTFHDVIGLLGGSPDDPLALVTDTKSFALQPRDYEVGYTADVRVQIVDVNGDGLGDPIIADIVGPALPVHARVVAFLGSKEFDFEQPLGDPPLIPGLDVIPSLSAPGDIDGDGYGDVLVATKTTSLVVFGAPDGLGVFSVLGQVGTMPNIDAGELPPPTVPMAIGGIDVDHDGRTDVALPSYYVDEGIFFTLVETGRIFSEPEIPIDFDAGILPTPATALGFGDVDGDGANDTAFVTTLTGKAAICILTSVAESRTGRLACWSPDTAPPAGFATSIVAVDLEGDGTDEFLVASATGGVDVLRLPTPDKVVAEHLALDYGVSLTVLDPGRPKPGVWAATRADGTGVALFQGKEQKRVITGKDLEFSLPYPFVRFQSGIR